jgi:hypothetical protein
LRYFTPRSSALVSHVARPNGAQSSIEEPAAKATYVRKTDRQKIYWHRADMKWNAYPPHPEAIFFDEFVVIVDEDEHCCFWG